MNTPSATPLPQRKHLAHLPPVKRHNTPVVVFVTFAVQPRGDFLANDAFQAAFTGACVDADAWSVGRFMIMPDHVHLFCAPAKEPRIAIKRWSGYLKERVTKRLNAILREGEAEPSRLEGEPGVSRVRDECLAEPMVEGETVASREREGSMAGGCWWARLLATTEHLGGVGRRAECERGAW